jgi:transposase-like protein
MSPFEIRCPHCGSLEVDEALRQRTRSLYRCQQCLRTFRSGHEEIRAHENLPNDVRPDAPRRTQG